MYNGHVATPAKQTSRLVAAGRLPSATMPAARQTSKTRISPAIPTFKRMVKWRMAKRQNGTQANAVPGQATVQPNNQANGQPNNQARQSTGMTTFQTSSNASAGSMRGTEAINLKREINDNVLKMVQEKLGQKQGRGV